MILKAEKQKIIKAFGIQYSSKILNILEEKGIKNSKGESFSSNSIRNIVNGLQENIEIEILILQQAGKELDRQQKVLLKRKQLFKN
ncbi:MAG: hypothetical protein ACK4JX_04450 [Flavobacterium sp.]